MYFWELASNRLFIAAYAACLLRLIAKKLRYCLDSVRAELRDMADQFETTATLFVEKCVKVTPVS